MFDQGGNIINIPPSRLLAMSLLCYSGSSLDDHRENMIISPPSKNSVKRFRIWCPISNQHTRTTFFSRRANIYELRMLFFRRANWQQFPCHTNNAIRMRIALFV